MPAPPLPLPPGDLLGMNLSLGHRLRDGHFPAPSETRRVDVLIAGGGVAGLSAAWQLARLGIEDFVLVDLEAEVGGNSRAGRSPVTAYPWGAHYLPLPGREAEHVRALLAELGVLQGDPAAERPVYDERYLCATPQERLYRHGLWEEGLLAQRGVSPAERDEQHRFQAHMEALKQARGRDSRRVFAIPMALSSRDPAWRALDRLSFRQWLLDHGYTAPTLHWLANYACRDDYGTEHGETSAWAGLHYFACRNGEAANAASDCVLTAPEGNAWLVRGLAARASGRLVHEAMVWRIADEKHGVSVDVLQGERSIRYSAKYLIWAAPVFVLPRVWPTMPPSLRGAALAGDYAPWLVANLHLDGLPAERHGAPPAWDNVLYQGPGLGYVTATHQTIRLHPGATVFTYYRALSDMRPADGRRLLLETSRETWAEAILGELSAVHPDIRERTRRLDVYRNGHAMRRPVPGSLFDGQREILAKFENSRMTLAHGDLSGFSLFEEAQHRGVLAAERCRAALRGGRRSAGEVM